MIYQRSIAVPDDMPQEVVDVYKRNLVRDALYEVMHDCFVHGKFYTFGADITYTRQHNYPFTRATVIDVVIDIRETPTIDFTMPTLNHIPALPPKPETVGSLLRRIVKILFHGKGKK